MSFPAANYISNAARTEGENKTAFEDQLKGTKQIPGAGVADQALTLASDAITPAQGASGIITVDTEAAAATDNLGIITQTNVDDGALLILRNANAGRVVVVKHNVGGTGQISLKTSGDFVLADPDRHWLIVKRAGTSYKEVARFPQADLAPILSKSSNYTTTPADRNQFIDCTATLTLSLLAAATAGKGFEQIVQCSGGITTIDPNGAETIDGSLTLLLYRGDKVRYVCDGTNWKVVDRHNAQSVFDKVIRGFTYGNNGSDATNDIDFAAGTAMDATGVFLLRGAALTKQLDVNWAVGNNAGMLDTGAVGNNRYYLWVIGRSDTGVVDYLASLSSSAPTMPANYDFKRFIGPLFRSGGANETIATRELPGGGLSHTTVKPSTSGTSLDFSILESNVVGVSVALNGASTNGTSDLIAQIGSGSVDTTGYAGQGVHLSGGGVSNATHTDGFALATGTTAATLYYGNGQLFLHEASTNTWIWSSVLAGGAFELGAGSKALSGVLDRLRFTTAGGVNTFDAGSISLTQQITR